MELTQTRREVRSDRIDATCMFEKVSIEQTNFQDLVEVKDEITRWDVDACSDGDRRQGLTRGTSRWIFSHRVLLHGRA